MTTFAIGSDNINGNESSDLQTIIKYIKKNGHTAENLGVGPNVVQSNGQTSNGKGKVGVQVIGGADADTWADFVAGIKQGYYSYSKGAFLMCPPSVFDNSWFTEDGIKNKKLETAHDSNGSMSSYWNGLTTEQFFKKYSQYVYYARGDTWEESVEMLCNGGGSVSSSDSDSNGSSGSSSAWDILKSVAGKNNDDININTFGDTVYVRKLPNKTYTHLYALDDYNVVQDSVTITEANPLMTNTIEVTYSNNKKEKTFKVSIPTLVKRYGEIKEQMVLGPLKFENAKAFANTYLCKLLRNDGFQIKLKVIGHPEYYPGRWCKVELDEYGIDDTYFIKTVSQTISSSDGNTCELTLCTYSPDLTTDTANEYGLLVEETETETSEDDSDEDSEDEDSEDSSDDTEDDTDDE